MKYKYPVLHNMAIKYLSMPACSCSSEREYSNVKKLLTLDSSSEVIDEVAKMHLLKQMSKIIKINTGIPQDDDNDEKKCSIF